jgi:hypothetical protein
MQRVVKLEGGSEQEVVEHIQAIDRCIKNKKKGK